MGDEKYQQTFETLKRKYEAGERVLPELKKLEQELTASQRNVSPMSETELQILQEKAKLIEKYLKVGQLTLPENADAELRAQIEGYRDWIISDRFTADFMKFIENYLQKVRDSKKEMDRLIAEKANKQACLESYQSIASLLDVLSEG